MIPAKGHGEELDFSLAAQRQQLYQSLSTSMPGATTQTAADAPRLGGLGGALQQRPAGPLGGGGGGGGGGLGMSVPSFAAALDEHSQRIQAQQAQAASKMASMLQQDQAAALYQQSATAAAAQRQVGGQPQAQQQGPGGMTQQQFSHLSHQAYTVQQFAQQHAAQQLAAQQAAAKAQQHAQRHAQQAQQLMRTNQAAAAGRKAHSASGAPRSLPLQSAQQPPTTGAARGKAAAQTTKDLKAIVAAHREELGQVIVWRRAVYNEHNAACDDEEDAALTRYVRNADLMQEIFTRAGTSDPTAEKEREERTRREIQEARRRVVSRAESCADVTPDDLEGVAKRRKRLEREAELIAHVSLASRSTQEQVAAAAASYTESTGTAFGTQQAGDAPQRVSIPAEEVANIHAQVAGAKSIVL